MLYSLTEILADAKKNKYAVGMFNCIDTDMISAVISTAEKLRSPVIISTGEVLLPLAGLELIGPSMVSTAKKASVPVCVHFDHGKTFENCKKALETGFTGVMFDGSALPHTENAGKTAEIVRLAHRFGAGVEGEIGHIAGVEGNSEAVEADDRYTTPDEAYEMISASGVDALAIAIGTAHGVYKSKPVLSIDSLKAISARVDTPLVLHGGSGLTDEDFRNTIANGICKVNIFTDLCGAGVEAMKKGAQNGANYKELHSLRVEAFSAVAEEKLTLFNSVGKA